MQCYWDLYKERMSSKCTVKKTETYVRTFMPDSWSRADGPGCSSVKAGAESLPCSLLRAFTQRGYWKLPKGYGSFTSMHVPRDSTAWHWLHTMQELCPVARWLILHCWQPDLLYQASTKERKHWNTPFVKEGDWWYTRLIASPEVTVWNWLRHHNIWRVTGRTTNTVITECCRCKQRAFVGHCLIVWCRSSRLSSCLCNTSVDLNY